MSAASNKVSTNVDTVAAASAATDLCISVHGNSVINLITREHLVCRVCTSLTLVKPIRQCQNGHTMCDECIRIKNRCPACNVSLVNARRIRNRFLEDLLEKASVACPYENRGCSQIFQCSSLEQHILNCDFGKVVLCPSLGMDNCHARICSDNWTQHVWDAHQLHVQAARHQNVSIVYSNFLTKKMVKEQSQMTWESAVLAPFRNAGPILIKCEVDVQKDCTATFSFIHATMQSTATDTNEDTEPYFVKFSICAPSQSACCLNEQVTWTGKSMLYSEFKNGSIKGVFKTRLGDYHPLIKEALTVSNTSNNTTTANTTANALVGAREPLSQITGMRMVASHSYVPRPRSARQVRIDLVTRIRIAKTLQELEDPLADYSSYGIAGISAYTIKPGRATFRAIKCDNCKQGPLRGVRYRCIECPKFDLCSACMAQRKVHTHHYFAYIRSTEQNARMTKNFKRIFREGPHEDDDEDTASDSESDEDQTSVVSS